MWDPNVWGPSDSEVEPMDSSDNIFHWYYQADCGFWHRIEDVSENFISTSDLEKYYSKNPGGVLEITTTKNLYRIDFADNLLINLMTGKKQKIRRLFDNDHSSGCACADKTFFVPSHWQNMDPAAPYRAFFVNPNTKEYYDVEKYVQEIGLMRESMKALYRVQNVDLWQLYCRKKTQLMRIKGQSQIEEQRLFHGTGKGNLHSICTYNFDCHLSDQRRHAHILGKGTYFAKHATYAHNYSKVEQGNARFIFLARVIVGKYTTGREHFYKPDGDQNEKVHDSCVDNVLCPRIFVIFDCNQIYPEYVLEYGH